MLSTLSVIGSPGHSHCQVTSLVRAEYSLRCIMIAAVSDGLSSFGVELGAMGDMHLAQREVIVLSRSLGLPLPPGLGSSQRVRLIPVSHAVDVDRGRSPHC